jgi:HK97 family phage portal protein
MERDITRQLSKALQGALVPNKLNAQLFVTLADGQPVWMGSRPEEFVRDAYSYNPDVFAVISLISRSVSAVPWVVHEVKNQKAYRKYMRMPSEAKQHNLARVMIAKEQAMVEVESGNPLWDLLERPNPYMGRSEFFEAMVGFKLITGNSYVHGVKIDTGVNAGKYGELWVMPAHLMEIIASKDPEHIIRSYRLNWYRGTDGIDIPADEVMHLKYFNPNYEVPGQHLYGMSPLQAARRVVTRSNEAYTANAKMLKNMAPPGILMLNDDGVDFTDTQASDLEKQWTRKLGSDKAGKIMVTAAKFDYKQLGLSPVDLNILESQKMDLRDICNVYGVSSELLNDPDNKTNSNKKESRSALYYERVIPELDTIRDELNRWLVAPYSKMDGKQYHIDYDLSAIPALQEDMEKVTKQLLDAWWLTPNEKRTAQGYDTLDTFDVPFIPSNLIPYDGAVDLEQLAKRIGDDYRT